MFACLSRLVDAGKPYRFSIPATEVQPEGLRIIGMLWTGGSCRRRQCWLLFYLCTF